MSIARLLEYQFSKLSAKLLKPKQKDHPSLNSISNSITAMLVYRELLMNPSLAHIIDQQPFSAEARSGLFSRLAATNKQVDGVVAIEGDLACVTMTQWLKIQLDLTNALLLQKDTVPISATFLKSIKHEERVRLPAPLSAPESLRDWFGDIAKAPLSLTTIIGGLTGWGATGTWYASGVLDIVSSVISAIGVGLLTIIAQTIWLDSLSRTDTFKTFFKELSPTWEEVFALKTRADAVLVGWLYDTLYTLRTTKQLVPDFYAMTPLDVAYTLGGLVSIDGQITESSKKSLANLMSRYTASHQCEDPNTLAKIDLTELVHPVPTSVD